MIWLWLGDKKPLLLDNLGVMIPDELPEWKEENDSRRGFRLAGGGG